MPKMGIADVTQHLGTDHTAAGVRLFSDMIRVEGYEIAWPAAAGIEFGVGGKQGCLTAGTVIDASFRSVPVAAGIGAFSALLAHDLILLGVKHCSPLGIGSDQLVVHGCHLQSLKKA